MRMIGQIHHLSVAQWLEIIDTSNLEHPREINNGRLGIDMSFKTQPLHFPKPLPDLNHVNNDVRSREFCHQSNQRTNLSSHQTLSHQAISHLELLMMHPLAFEMHSLPHVNIVKSRYRKIPARVNLSIEIHDDIEQ